MPEGEKPYRLYRGGRTKGRVPLASRPARVPARDGRREPRSEPVPARRRRRPRWGRRIALALGALVLFVVVWTVASYFAFRGGVAEANARLGSAARAALADQQGLVVNEPTTILLLGTDGDPRLEARADARRSDSIMLIRTDPARRRIAYLSIPRDLRVDIPGYGPNRINAAFQLGGPALALKTVKAFTQLEVNHVAVVDFADFRRVIDALGGIEVDVPAPIVSNRFDCPYATQERCSQWQGWRFAKGKQRMDGRRALVYARIRENRLNPAETDFTRGARQQAVVQAMMDELTSVGTFLRLPFIGGDLVKPLTTDLSAGQLLQLGWVKFRSADGSALHCRLGGTPYAVGGQSVLVATEENFAVMAMFAGRSAPQPPLPGSGPFGPGCAVGRPLG